MNFKKQIAFILSTVLLFSFFGTNITKNVIFENEIGSFTERAKKQAATITLNTGKQEKVFSTALDLYKTKFGDYLDITALNVSVAREEVALDGFDIDYVVPLYTDIMHDYQEDLLASLNDEELNNYEQLRISCYDFDRYASLNEIRYQTLEPDLKYTHSTITIDPKIEINPGSGTTIGPTPLKSPSSSGTVTTLAAILLAAGLTEIAIGAFEVATAAIGVGVSTSWIPIVGWALAAAIVAGALIALTCIIVQNWTLIRSVIDQIKNYFMSQFSAFASMINSFFDDAVAQGNESTVAGRVALSDGTEIVFRGDGILLETAAALVDEAVEDEEKVFLMKEVGRSPNPDDYGNEYLSFWYSDEAVDSDYVTTFKLYDLGISTYTWLQYKAYSMMAFGTTLFSGRNSEKYHIKYHSFVGTEKNSMNGWDHYHVYKEGINPLTKKEDLVRIEGKLIRNAHSFFGAMYMRLTPGVDDFEMYPG